MTFNRSDRRPAPRPPLKPTLTIAGRAVTDAASMSAIDERTRALAAALVDTFSPTQAWQWACAIDVVPGIAGALPLITLRYRRHEASEHGSILDDYEITWRELAEPLDDVRAYARAVHEHVDEARRLAVIDYANEWGAEHPPTPTAGPSPV